MQRRRLMMPPHPVLAQLAWEVLTTRPTDEELHLLLEVVEEAQVQNLEPAEIETRVRGTRIWHWLMVIAKNDVRSATDLMLLLMIIDPRVWRSSTGSTTTPRQRWPQSPADYEPCAPLLEPSRRGSDGGKAFTYIPLWTPNNQDRSRRLAPFTSTRCITTRQAATPAATQSLNAE
jgi:hypothetical protein